MLQLLQYIIIVLLSRLQPENDILLFIIAKTTNIYRNIIFLNNAADSHLARLC